MEKIPKEFWDDDEWAEKHYADLQEKYKDEWVAVVDKQVVSHGSSLSKVEEEAKIKTRKKEYSRNKIILRLISIIIFFLKKFW